MLPFFSCMLKYPRELHQKLYFCLCPCKLTGPLYVCCSFIYLFIWVLRRFQHCTGHIMTGSWKGRGNQYIQLVRVLYCKLLTNGKQLPAFPLQAVTGIEPRPQRWEAESVITLPPWPLFVIHMPLLSANHT